MQTTVGPLPPAVYWRRRLVLLGILVLAFVGVRACAGGDTSTAGAGDAAKSKHSKPLGTTEHPYIPTVSSPIPTPIPTPSGSPSPKAKPVVLPPGGTCTDAEILLTATTDAKAYRVGAKPQLTMKLTNVGTRACRRDLGPPATELSITSGPAHTWSTDDCEPGGAPVITLLQPRESRTFVIPWSGRRSLPKCAGERPVAGAGTYRLQARLGGLRSDHAVFHLA